MENGDLNTDPHPEMGVVFVEICVVMMVCCEFGLKPALCTK
jgi:hypothetical protein